ncbi:hypothetical protein [Aminipila sp.]|uniref:hypothetical protein n=1 Tax=Aminipila sp. TaxID=2060095 RepID=UPI0028986524|nr:hypothetical protein [Aminipila sp.]
MLFMALGKPLGGWTLYAGRQVVFFIPINTSPIHRAKWGNSSPTKISPNLSDEAQYSSI